MYKMIALDLDDTLLDDNWKISKKNKEAIRAAIKSGIIVVLISGRSYSSTKSYLKELGIDYFTGSLNGACVIDPVSDNVEYNLPIDKSISYEILSAIEPEGIHINLYDGHKVFCRPEAEYAQYYMELTNTQLDYLDSLTEYVKEKSTGKLLMIADRQKLEKIREKIWERYKDQVNITYSKPTFLEIYHKTASKGEALKVIAQRYGINREEIMAIGDGENDIPMIKYAGLGIAMSNASDKVKAEADFVTLSNNESGVAYAINKFIFNK